MTNQLNSQMFPEVYTKLGIEIGKLGCIMLELEPIPVTDLVMSYYPSLGKQYDLYYSRNKDYWWIDGPVAEEGAHMTVLYGLMEPGPDWKEHVDAVLDGWMPDSIQIEDVTYFDSPYGDEPYYCIIGHVKLSDDLTEGNKRLRLLPHIDTFPDYRPHVTLAYIEKSQQALNDWIEALSVELKGKELKTTHINYGKKK